MNYINYIEINKENLNYNLEKIKNKYNYKYVIMDVSNNAFFHGMYIINYLKNVDYLYVNNFNDVILIRKYNKEMPIIYEGEININNIYDLIINNVILVIKKPNILDNIEIKEKIDIILKIDVRGYNGFSDKNEVNEFVSSLREKKDANILGVIANIWEDDYLEFRDIIKGFEEAHLMILNNENDKKKIKLSNGIKLNYSIYGINDNTKKSLFKKEEEKDFKQVMTVYSKIVEVKKETFKKKEKYIGVIPMGYLNGMNENITHVYIKGELYPVREVFEDYCLIELDIKVNVLDKVEIISYHNPLEKYFKGNVLNYLGLFSNMPIRYEDYILEKTYVY